MPPLTRRTRIKPVMTMRTAGFVAIFAESRSLCRPFSSTASSANPLTSIAKRAMEHRGYHPLDRDRHLREEVAEQRSQPYKVQDKRGFLQYRHPWIALSEPMLPTSRRDVLATTRRTNKRRLARFAPVTRPPQPG
jgi:hypothetical protein